MREDPDYRSLKMTNEEWSSIQWLVDMLGPFKETTLMIESHACTISQFIPLVNNLIDGLEDGTTGFDRPTVLRRTACQKAKESLKLYYSKTVDNTWYTSAMSKSLTLKRSFSRILEPDYV